MRVTEEAVELRPEIYRQVLRNFVRPVEQNFDPASLCRQPGPGSSYRFLIGFSQAQPGWRQNRVDALGDKLRDISAVVIGEFQVNGTQDSVPPS